MRGVRVSGSGTYSDNFENRFGRLRSGIYSLRDGGKSPSKSGIATPQEENRFSIKSRSIRRGRISRLAEDAVSEPLHEPLEKRRCFLRSERRVLTAVQLALEGI